MSPQYHVRHYNFFETTLYSKRDISIPSTWQQLAGYVSYNGDTSLEMSDVIHQDNEAYMSEAMTNMAHNVQDHPQITRSESTGTLNIMKTNLVSIPNEL